METQRKVRNAKPLNDWAFSLDLTDAYLHVQIHPLSGKYLQFTPNGRRYHFKAVPFGLSISPSIFRILMTAIATNLRKKAIIMHPYQDDWLAGNQNLQTVGTQILAGNQNLQTVGTQILHNLSYNIPRLDYQLPEIRPHSYSNFHFHRDGISDKSRYQRTFYSISIGGSRKRFINKECP